MTRRGRWQVRGAVLALVAVAACGGGEEALRADREEIRVTLEAYLPRLAEAYSQREFAGLEGIAAPKEIAAIEKRIQDLALQGRALEPEFRGLTIEEIDRWSHSNAYVTTVEVWDLKVYSTGSRQLLSEEIGQRSRVKYQLKRGDEGWLILFRTIVGGA